MKKRFLYFLKNYKYTVHLTLFLITLCCSIAAGIEWSTTKLVLFSEITAHDLNLGLQYAISFLGILTVHEFGHYLTARYYKLDVSLPYYIPFWIPIGPSLGTMGAFISINSPMRSKKEFFDVGIAGPLAGFIAALGVLIYGFTHLPPPEYIFSIHPEYKQWGYNYAQHAYDVLPEGANFKIGENLLFKLMTNWLVDDLQSMPNAHELMHYPFLMAGYLACFFTSLNLLPIGQLDGGHILYGVFGYKKAKNVSFVLFLAFVFYAGLGLFNFTDFTSLAELPYIAIYIGFLYLIFEKIAKKDKVKVWAYVFSMFTLQLISSSFFGIEGYSGWLLFTFLLGRVLGVTHPPALYEEDLGLGRKILAFISLVVFILCATPSPFIFE
ncbi:site-2 protease family protein [Sediminitomix flava]|uniref:Peptidase M50-like protein n=1 Tax=Sediminitomix flava TaxID=379075 RepID=A0A315ZIF4_SEDFL|nr:site-2 protease family protein [Sediminitomix flava]PWJ44989.1 peptidase M50-like protein [Sediminitomix flava]